MKKLLLGAIILLLFAVAISIIEISCQKIHAQVNRPASPTSSGTILFEKAIISDIIPYTTTTTTTDSITHITTTITKTTYDTFYSATNLFVSNIDGSNVRQIPIPIPSGSFIPLDNSTRPCLTANADSVVFFVSTKSLPYSSGIYTCALDGTGYSEVIPSGSTTTTAVYLCDVK